MKSWFAMNSGLESIEFKGETDFRYPEELAKKFILEFTKKGDRVLDPFAGFGTTLFAAQKLGRIGVGIEYDKARFEFIKARLNPPNKVIHGSSLKLDSYGLPKFDFSLTSPPFTTFSGNKNPFRNYTEPGNYAEYLADLGRIYSQIKNLMKKNSRAVIEVANTFTKDQPMTPLAWDIAKEISKILFLEREIIYCHEGGNKPDASNHSYCLIFNNK